MGGHNSLQHGYTIVYNRGAHCAPPWGLSLFSDAGAGRVKLVGTSGIVSYAGTELGPAQPQLVYY